MAIGKLIYDSAVGNRIPTEYANKQEREDAIRQSILETLGLDSYEKNTFRKAMRKHKNEVYEIMEEVTSQIMINGDYAKDVFFETVVELKNLSIGDENSFYVEGNNELTVAEFSGNHFNIKRRRFDAGETFSVSMKDFGIRVYEYFERIASGRVDFAQIVMKMSEAIEKQLATLAQTTFASALANLPTEFKNAGAYDEEGIMEIATHVQSSTGEKPYAMGTATALRKLQGIKDITKYSDNMKDIVNNTGYLSVWNGYTCLEIPQGHKSGTFDFTMDDKVVYFFTGGEKPVKMVIEGETEVREIGSTWDGAMNADKTVEQTLTYKAGATVAYNKLLGKYTFA